VQLVTCFAAQHLLGALVKLAAEFDVLPRRLEVVAEGGLVLSTWRHAHGLHSFIVLIRLYGGGCGSPFCGMHLWGSWSQFLSLTGFALLFTLVRWKSIWITLVIFSILLLFVFLKLVSNLVDEVDCITKIPNNCAFNPVLRLLPC
jgi:hypothetical protein